MVEVLVEARGGIGYWCISVLVYWWGPSAEGIPMPSHRTTITTLTTRRWPSMSHMLPYTCVAGGPLRRQLPEGVAHLCDGGVEHRVEVDVDEVVEVAEVARGRRRGRPTVPDAVGGGRGAPHPTGL